MQDDSEARSRPRSTHRVATAALSAALLVFSAAWALAQDARSLEPAIRARYPDVRGVETATLARWMRRPAARRPVLLDARSASEFAVSHLRGAVRVDPVAPDFATLGLHPSSEVVVYCSVGWRSAAVADALRVRGQTRVRNLIGGIFQWANEGRPVYRGDERTQEVHPYDAVWGRMLAPRHHPRR